MKNSNINKCKQADLTTGYSKLLNNYFKFVCKIQTCLFE